MSRINESEPIEATEVFSPLVNKEPDAPEELNLPTVRRLRFVARALMLTAQKRKERMVAYYKAERARQAEKNKSKSRVERRRGQQMAL